LTFQREIEVMLAEDLLNKRQTNPLAILLSREKGREEIGAHDSGYAAAGVFHDDKPSPRFVAHTNRNASIRSNRFDGILGCSQKPAPSAAHPLESD
jgi:hypothetical protein